MQYFRQSVKDSCIRTASFTRNGFGVSKNFFSALRDLLEAKRIGPAQRQKKKRLAYPTFTPTASKGIHTKESFEKEWSAIYEEKYRPDQAFLAKMKVFGGFRVPDNGDDSDERHYQTFEEIVTTCGVIREVQLTKRGAHLKIKGDKLTFVTHAFGHCCSQSWFEAYKNMSFQDLVGKSIVAITQEEKVEYRYSGRDLYDENDLFSLVLVNEDGSKYIRPTPTKKINMESEECVSGDGGAVDEEGATNFKFLFRNSSNGYYSGYLAVQSCCATGTEEVYVKNPDARVVFVLGLPFVSTPFHNRDEWAANGYDTLDDCLFDPLFSLQTKEKLELGERLIMNDPRFCELDKFRRAYKQVLRSLVSANQISIVTFENNPEQCNKNNEEKKRHSTWCASSAEYITKLSKGYPKTLRYVSRRKDCVQHQVPVAVPPDRRALLKLRRSENEAKGDYLSLLGVY